ncbi:unnamed protein product [Protopolystoma xenopodis]|uniref:Uncharacterized protein n=1 Tax=Protopolystoma xenopodis TaxID=117903 RepID=A0A448X793_9PLAT|nr:unnamed protein product [Protopolystoma xenopodis]
MPSRKRCRQAENDMTYSEAGRQADLTISSWGSRRCQRYSNPKMSPFRGRPDSNVLVTPLPNYTEIHNLKTQPLGQSRRHYYAIKRILSARKAQVELSQINGD